MHSYAKGFTLFPSQSTTKRPPSTPRTPSLVSDSRSATVDSPYSPPSNASSTPDPLIPQLLITIIQLTSRVAALETAIQRHTSVTDDHIHTFTLNQQQIYNKILLLLDQTAPSSSHVQPTPISSETPSIALQPEAPLPIEPPSATERQHPSSATITSSEPHLPIATTPATEPSFTAIHSSVPTWPPLQPPAPSAPLQFTPMDPLSDFQILYVPIHEKVTPARMRQKLRDIRLSSRMAIDVHFPAAQVMSLLVQNKHFNRCQKILYAAHLTTLPDFDPLDPAHLFNPQFLNRSNTERSVEM